MSEWQFLMNSTMQRKKLKSEKKESRRRREQRCGRIGEGEPNLIEMLFNLLSYVVHARVYIHFK